MILQPDWTGLLVAFAIFVVIVAWALFVKERR